MYTRTSIFPPTTVTVSSEEDALLFPRGSVLTADHGLFVVTGQDGDTLTVRPFRWYDRILAFFRRLRRLLRRK